MSVQPAPKPSRPVWQRNGDKFILTWPDMDHKFIIDHITEQRWGGLTGQIVVARQDGDYVSKVVLGPLNLKLMDMRDQETFANTLSRRVNGHPNYLWHGMTIQACTIVTREWRSATPAIDVDTYEATRVEYVVSGLVPKQETTVMYGDGESAKSLCAMMLSVCLKTGTKLPWGDAPVQQNVLYLDWETNPNTSVSRISRICTGMGIPTPNIKYRACYRGLLDEQEVIRNEISQHNIDLIVIDSIGFAMGGSLNDDDVARSAITTLRSFAPATRLVVAHVSKAEADRERGRARPFGSIFFWNGMRSGIEVRRAQDQPEDDVINVGLYHQKANDGSHHKPVGLRISFDGLDGAIAFDPENIAQVPELGERLSQSQRIRNLLRQGAMTTAELAAELDTSDATIRNALKRMPDAIQLDPGGRGNPARWGLVSP